MFYEFQSSVLAFWDFWCSLFAPLPYGDPYVAGGALIVLLIFAGRTVTRCPDS